MPMMHNPSHPGRILAAYMTGYTVKEVAEHLGVTRTALSRVLHGHAGISAEMALRLSQTFNTDPQMWLALQTQRDLWEASERRPKARKLPQRRAA